MATSLLNVKGFLSPETGLSDKDGEALWMAYHETMELVSSSYRDHLSNLDGENRVSLLGKLLRKALHKAAQTQLKKNVGTHPPRWTHERPAPLHKGKGYKTAEKTSLSSCGSYRSVKELEGARRNHLISRATFLERKQKLILVVGDRKGKMTADNQTRHLAKVEWKHQNSSSQTEETSTAEMERVLMEIDTFWTVWGPQCATIPVIGRGFVAITTPTDSSGNQPGSDLKLDKLCPKKNDKSCPSGATHLCLRPAISECEKILLSHGIIERIWSFLEGRKLVLICKTWKTITEVYETYRQSISFQPSGISANSLVQFPGKFKHVRDIT
jgi:hypothetical protein